MTDFDDALVARAPCEDSLYAGIGLDIDNDIDFDMGVGVCLDTIDPVEE